MTRAIDFRRFVEFFGHALQASKQDNHDWTNGEHAHQYQRRLDPGLAEYPRGSRDANLLQGVIQDAQARIEYPNPHQRHRHAGRHCRQIIDGAEEGDARHFLIEQYRQQQGERHAENDPPDYNIEGVTYRCPENRIGKELRIIV